MSIWTHLLCRRPLMSGLHVKCRDIKAAYLRSKDVRRLEVPDDRVSWSKDWPEYSPPDYTDPALEGKPWADPVDPSRLPFNTDDGHVNRRSHECDYAVSATTGRPLNIRGRTGLAGRGVLGRWGPNHAADPLVTRINKHTGRTQFVAIKRGDTGEWALPGGMVDSGERVSQTLKREFGEEALGGDAERAARLEQLWRTGGNELYKGYVDDPRNTDNAWMETVVVHFHDEQGILADVKLEAADDAVGVRWVDVEEPVRLYASHEHFIRLLRTSLKSR